MTAYTSTQAGNWSDTATWGGGGTPGDGDTASIGHAVTVDANTTVGTSPNDTTTYVVVTTSGGVITIPDGVTLTVEGNVQLGGVVGGTLTKNLQINGAGKLVFDGSPVSSSRNYLLRCEYRCSLQMAGTDGSNRATIESDAGGGYWQLSLQSASAHLESLSWARLTRCGDASNNGMTSYSSVFANAGNSMSITDTIFEDCGLMQFRQSIAGTITLARCVFESLSSDSCYLNNAVAGGTLTVDDCVFSGRVLFWNSEDWLLTGNYFGNGVINQSNDSGMHASCSGNFMLRPNATARTWYGSIRGCYFFDYYLDNQNIQTVTPRATGAGQEIVDNIQDFGNTSPSNPDGYFITQNGSGNDYSAKRNIFLPDSASTASGCWLNVYYATAGTVAIEHNTVIVNGVGQTGTYMGESGGGAAGQITSFKSNLFWTLTGDVNGGGHKLVRHNGSTTQDIADSSDCDYNWGWNLDAGSEGDGYQCDNTATAMFSSGTPDGNGGSGDPQFVDSSRNLIRFDIDNLGNAAATAWSDATAYSVGDTVSASDAGYFGGDTINWRCINAHTSNDGDATNGKPGSVTGFRTNWEPMSLYRLREDTSRIADLLTWVRGGFAVQNASLEDAGHDSVTIGAGAYVASGPTYTLTANHGATELDGQDATLTASRLLTVNHGTTELDGQNATLSASRLLTANHGATELAGQDATLTASRLLTVDHGAVELAGQSVDLTYNSGAATYTLTATAGAIELAGQGVTLEASRLLTVSHGATELNGQSATLAAQRVLSASHGAIELAGQATSLLTSRVLSANHSSLELSGQSVSLVYSDASGINVSQYYYRMML